MTFYGTTATGAGWIVPKKYVEKVGDEGFKKAPIGAGPYRFVSSTPGVEMVLEAFEGYWRKVPSVKRLVFKSVPDETTRAAALKRGEVDIAYFLNGPVAEDVRRTPGLKLTAMRTNAVFFLDSVDQWDPKSPWHDQPRAARREPRHRPEGDQRGGVARVLGAHRQHRAAPHGVRAAASTRTPTTRSGPSSSSSRRAIPNGFDGGDITPNPPYFSMARGGVDQPRRRRDPDPRAGRWSAPPSSPPGARRSSAASCSARRARAATRRRASRALATRGGMYAYGVLPEVEDLFQRQARETRPEEARGAAPPDPADPVRPGHLRADLGERVHPGRGPAGGGARAHAHPRLPVLGPARGSSAQEPVMGGATARPRDVSHRRRRLLAGAGTAAAVRRPATEGVFAGVLRREIADGHRQGPRRVTGVVLLDLLAGGRRRLLDRGAGRGPDAPRGPDRAGTGPRPRPRCRRRAGRRRPGGSLRGSGSARRCAPGDSAARP